MGRGGDGMGDTWHGVLGVLCHVACHGHKASPPPLTPTILTFAPKLAPPWEAKPSQASTHQPHILGNGGVLSQNMWVAALGSSW